MQKLSFSLPALFYFLIGIAVIMLFGFNTSLFAAKHADNQQLKKDENVEYAKIVLGSGCFWGAEKRFQAMEGVIDAVSGYADGRGLEPIYKAITQAKHRLNPDNFAEVVEVTYNPNITSLQHILKVFFENHNPTQGDRQGNDVGTQYRSTILYADEAQKRMAKNMLDRYQVLLSKANFGKITTKIAPLDEFFPAEEEHQDYLAKNPNGYCPDHSTGVKFEDEASNKQSQVDNKPLLKDQHILVLEAEFCPYCEKFKQDIASSYKGSIALHYRSSQQLQGLDLTTPAWATPTVFFIEDGKEVFAHQGYMDKEKFYQALGLLKLKKDSEAYNIAFNGGTENRFCRQYDLFKDTPDGVFIDKLSGEPLFDTKHRFNSNSGWLSFTQAVKNTTIETPDNSYGMQRIEVRAKISGIHLGHVFEDGPNGQRRFCINATVLEFKPR